MATSVEQFIGWEGLLGEEEKAVRDMTRKFVADRILPHIVDDFAEGRFRKELALELGELGILGANLTGYGCPGISHVSYGMACHELEYGDSGLRSFVSVQTSLAMYAIWRWGSEDQKNRWLPEMAAGRAIGCFGLTEPNHGSDPASMGTRAVKDGDDWLLTGSKMWITSASIADVAVVWAKTGEDPSSMRGFIVERGMAGFSAHDIPHKLSMRASSTGGLMLDNVRVPEGNRLPKAAGMRGPLSCLNNARFGVSWGVLGAARFCLEKATEYSVERQQWGGPIARKQLVQGQLADMISEVVKASLLSLHYGRLKEAGTLRAPQVSLLKRNNCRIALMCARTARGLMGGNGITGEYHVMRHAMNLESTYTYEGTDEIHSLVLGHALTGQRAY
ncbi:MAG: acyl-CoA dehydrogenase family protein [Myxococcales bacterium]|nr:acyl-CoA dehydrogenase family protein [Myxococcales bacterium]